MRFHRITFTEPQLNVNQRPASLRHVGARSRSEAPAEGAERSFGAPIGAVGT